MNTVKRMSQIEMSSYSVTAQFYNILFKYKIEGWYFKEYIRSNFIERRISKQGIDINYQIPELSQISLNNRSLSGCTMLHIAVLNQDLDTVKILLDRGADFTLKNTDGYTALHKANDYTIMDTILTAHVKTKNFSNPTCKNGISHFHIACMVDNPEAAKFFLEAGVSINQAINQNSPTFPSYTPLHLAVLNKRLEIVELLLTFNANMDLKNTEGLNPLHLAIKNHVMELSDSCPCSLPLDVESLLELLMKNRRQKLHNYTDEIGLSDFHILCTLRNSVLVSNFLDERVDVNAALSKDSPINPGYTALHFALNFNMKTVKILLENGANVLAKDTKGITPLDQAKDIHNFLRHFRRKDIQSILKNQQITDVKLLQFLLEKSELSCIWYTLTNRNNLKDIPCYEAFKVFNSIDASVRKNSYFSHLLNVNAVIPNDSELWPGYSVLHLAVILDHEETDIRQQNVYHNRIIKCLTAGANITTKNAEGLTPIHLAFRMHLYQTVELLLYYQYREETSLENATDPNNLSHFHIACVMCHHSMVRKFLKNGIDVDSSVKDSFKFHENKSYGNDFLTAIPGSTPLHIAVINRNNNLIKLLVENNADANIKNSDGQRPVDLALQYGHGTQMMEGSLEKIIRTLLSATKIEIPTIEHLYAACLVKNTKIIEEFIKQGADVNMTIDYSAKKVKLAKNDTLLHWAVKNNCPQIYKFLLRSGANVLLKNVFGCSPLHFDFLGIIRELIENYNEASGFSQLHVACAANDINLIKNLLMNGANVNERIHKSGDIEMSGYTPIHILFQFYEDNYRYSKRTETPDYDERFRNILLLLKEYGADITIRDDMGSTPIHLAIKRSFRSRDDDVKLNLISFAHLLLTNEKNVTNPIDRDGFSHFHVTCCMDDTTLVERYLKCGAGVNETVDPFRNSNHLCLGYSPLHFAVKRSCGKVIEVLLQNGADVTKEDADGNTPLHLAAQSRLLHEDIIEMILRKGVDVNARNLWGRTSIDLTLMNYGGVKKDERFIKYIELSIKYGYEVNVFDPVTRKGFLAMTISKLQLDPNNMLPVFNEIIKSPSLTRLNENGSNAIHNIVQSSDSLSSQIYIEAIGKLLDLGCELDHQDNNGRTALHVAASFKNKEAIKALLSFGADINIVDNSNRVFCYYLLSDPFFFKYTHYQYVRKMIIADFHVVKPHKSWYSETKLFWNLNFDGEETGVHSELEKMKIIEIYEGFSVYDLLKKNVTEVITYRRATELERESLDDFFESIDKIRLEYPYYSCFLLKHRLAYEKFKTFELALEAMIYFDRRMPVMVVEEILKHLEKKDHSNFIAAMKIT